MKKIIMLSVCLLIVISCKKNNKCDYSPNGKLVIHCNNEPHEAFINGVSAGVFMSTSSNPEDYNTYFTLKPGTYQLLYKNTLYPASLEQNATVVIEKCKTTQSDIW